MKNKPLLVFLLLLPATSLPLQSQTATNASLQLPNAQVSTTKQSIVSTPLPALQNAPTNADRLPKPKTYRKLTPEELQYLAQQGVDTNKLQGIVAIYDASELRHQVSDVNQTPTPANLKNAGIWMDSFLGETNTTIAADIISMKPDTLKFRLAGQDYNYSGHYTVVLNTPRQHKNPYFGFGSPETVKLVILEDFGGESMYLPNATIWEKRDGFITVVALGREWIYSGDYTIQN
jgi:hypothetical protein